MRIGVIHWAFLPFVGGVETHIATIYPEIAKQGVKVFLLTGSHKDAPSKENFKGVKVTRINELVPNNIKSWVKNKKDIKKTAKQIFEKFIKNNRIDIVHAHNFNLGFFEYSEALTEVCKKKKIPCLLVAHNDYFIYDPETTKKIIAKIPWTRFISISKYLTRVHKKINHHTKKKWITIPHGIDLNVFKPIPKVKKEKIKDKFGFKNRKIILLSARILPNKGTLESVKAMSKVRHKFPEAILVLIGIGKHAMYKKTKETYVSNVKREIKKLKLDKNVTMIKRFLTTEELSKLYAASDILINPSVYIEEPFGLCPVEGMASGVPIIVTKSGGLVESTVNGVTGFIISKNPKKVPTQLANKIIYLLKHPQLREKMGKAGRKRVEKLFDKKRMTHDFIDVSKKIIKEFNT